MNKTILLVVIIILGAVVRSVHIGSFGIWNDEQASILIANGETRYFIHGDKGVSDIDLDRFTNIQRHAQNTLPKVLQATINDNGNSYAFNFLLHYWLLVFGKSDISARLLSLLFGLLIIPLAYRFASELFKNEYAALIIAFLFAIHPLFVEYSIMCRAYTMATFFSILSSYLFYRIITSRAAPRTYFFYALTVGISLLTHYLTSYVFIAHGLIFLLYVRDSKVWVRYILAGALIVLIFGAWMYADGINGLKVLTLQNAMNKAIAMRYKPGDTGGAAFILPSTPKNIITGYMEVWLQLFSNQLEYLDFRVRTIALLLLLPFSLIAMMIWRKWKDPDERKVIIILLILTFMQTAYATAEALRSGHCKSFHPLYANFAVPYAIMLLGYGIYVCYRQQQLRMFTSVVTLGILVINVYSFKPTYGNLRGIYPEKNFHRISAEEIKNKYRSGDTVSIRTSIDAKLINLYLPDDPEIDQKIDSNINGLYLIPKR